MARQSATVRKACNDWEGRQSNHGPYLRSGTGQEHDRQHWSPGKTAFDHEKCRSTSRHTLWARVGANKQVQTERTGMQSVRNLRHVMPRTGEAVGSQVDNVR